MIDMQNGNTSSEPYRVRGQTGGVMSQHRILGSPSSEGGANALAKGLAKPSGGHPPARAGSVTASLNGTVGTVFSVEGHGYISFPSYRTSYRS